MREVFRRFLNDPLVFIAIAAPLFAALGTICLTLAHLDHLNREMVIVTVLGIVGQTIVSLAGSLAGIFARRPEAPAPATPPVVLIPILIVVGALLGAPAHAAPAVTATSSAAAAWPIEVHAAALLLHADGSLGAGASMCIGHALGPVQLDACPIAEVRVANDGGSASGRIGGGLAVGFPALAPALKSMPSIGVGWVGLVIGPGDLIDPSKRSLVFFGSLSLFAL
jgi:hypothetical protein